jgi:hypothetical protein
MSSTSSFEAKVDESINHICDKLKLTAFVRAKCIEMCTKVKPKESAKISDQTANAVACAIVSIVHEDAKRNGRVDRHLPDRIIGKLFGLTSTGVVYNKRLINRIRTPNKA